MKKIILGTLLEASIATTAFAQTSLATVSALGALDSGLSGMDILVLGFSDPLSVADTSKFLLSLGAEKVTPVAWLDYKGAAYNVTISGSRKTIYCAAIQVSDAAHTGRVICSVNKDLAVKKVAHIHKSYEPAQCITN